MPTHYIRPAVASDAAEISALTQEAQALHAQAMPWRFKQSSAETFPIEMIAEWMGNPNAIWLISETMEALVGYVYAEIVRKPETSFRFAYEVLFIHHLAVAAAHQRQGAGAGLLAAVHDEAKERGIETVELDVWSFNVKARTFFEKNGLWVFNERLWNHP